MPILETSERYHTSKRLESEPNKRQAKNYSDIIARDKILSYGLWPNTD